MPFPYRILQDSTDTTTNTGDPITDNPPVNTNPNSSDATSTTDGLPLGTADPFILGIIVLLVVAVIFIIIIVLIRRHLKNRPEQVPSDVIVTSKDINAATELRINAFLGLWIVLILIVLVVAFILLVTLYENLGMLGASFIALTTSFLSIRYYLQVRARDGVEGRKQLKGIQWDLKGNRIPYWWHKCKILPEYVLKETERKQLIEPQTKTIKKKVKKLDEKTNEEIEVEVEENVTIPCMIDTAELDKQHPYAVLVGAKLCIILFDVVLAQACEWLTDWDYDIFGYYEIDTSYPELVEIGSINIVVENPDDELYRYNRSIPVFRAIWHDAQAKKAASGQAIVNPTHEENLIGYAKIMGVERKHTAGEVNRSVSALADALVDKDMQDVLVQSLSHAEANRLWANKKTLSELDMIQETGWLSTIKYIASALIWTVFGYALHIIQSAG